MENRELKKGNNEIKIIKSGKGTLYLSGIGSYFSTREKAAAKLTSFKVMREYFILEPKKKDGRIIYQKKKLEGEIKSGQDILVKTYVESKEDGLEYFILEDMLPSGFEVVKDDNLYVIDGESNYNNYIDYYYGYRPWRWFYADREYRDEKVSFFVTNVSKSMEFSCIIKAQIPGEYSINPAQGYLMYYPEVRGNSSFFNITVKD